MKTLILALFTWGLCFGQSYTIESYKSKYSGWTVSYAKIVPKDYDPTKSYPLLVAEHGNGEKTWNGSTRAKVEAVLTNSTHVGYNVLKSPKNYQMVTIIPVTPFSPSWPTFDNGKTTKFVAGAFLTEVIDTVTKYTRIDQSRIYITGLSEGGGDMWDFMTLYANRVAACVPISAWNPVANTTWEKTIADSKTPIWHFQSDNDAAGGSASNLGTYFSRISKLGAKVNFTVFQQDGHGIWSFPYKGVQSPTHKGTAFNYTMSDQPADIYEWMLSQRKGTASDTIKPDTIIHDTIVIPIKKFVCDSLQATVFWSTKSLEGGYWKICNYTQNFTLDSLSFDWGNNAPFGSRKDSVYAKIYGRCKAYNSGNYTFYMSSDDGSRLSLNGTKVIDDYTNHAARERSATYNMTADTWVNIGIDYYESQYSASLKLMVSGPEVKKQVIKRK